MKRLVFTLFYFYTAFMNANAQSNLVLNPSFEHHYDTSVIGVASFREGYIQDWSDPNHASSDYFVPNSNGGFGTPPLNFTGFEYPHSDLCFAGFVFYDGTPFSTFAEYVQGKFLTPLVAGKSYSIESYVSLAEYSLCLSNLGFYFSDTLFSTYSGAMIPVVPQFLNPSSSIISVQSGWQRITGSYTAHGGEKYVSIGNFTPYSLCNVDTCSEFNGSCGCSYLYIDDVAVYDTSKVDTIQLCLNDSIQIGGVWRHNAGLYTDIIGGLPVRFYVQPRPYSNNITIIERPFAQNDSVRISIIQTGGIDSTSNSHNYIYVKRDTVIDVPMYNIYGCDSTVRYVCGTHINIGVELSKQFDWSLLPNPANESLYVKLTATNPTNYTVKILDLTGKEVLSRVLLEDKLDISSLKSGMYFVRLFNTKTDNLIGVEKFVKE